MGTKLTICEPDAVRTTDVGDDGRVYLGEFKGRQVRLTVEVLDRDEPET